MTGPTKRARASGFSGWATTRSRVPRMDEERLERVRQEALALYREGVTAQASGKYEDAEANHSRCHRLMKAMGNRNGEAAALHQLGNLAEARGDYANARRQFLESYALFAAEGDDQNRLFSLFSQALLALKAGDQADGVDSLLQAVDLGFQLGPVLVQESWSRVRQAAGVLFAIRKIDELHSLGNGLSEVTETVLTKHAREGPLTQLARITSQMGSFVTGCAKLWLPPEEVGKLDLEELASWVLQTAVNLDQMTGGAMSFTDLAAKAIQEKEGG